MIRASLEPGGNSDNTSGLSSSSSRRKCRVCVTIETTSSLEGSTESLGGRGGQRGIKSQAERNLFFSYFCSKSQSPTIQLHSQATHHRNEVFHSPPHRAIILHDYWQQGPVQWQQGATVGWQLLGLRCQGMPQEPGSVGHKHGR